MLCLESCSSQLSPIVWTLGARVVTVIFRIIEGAACVKEEKCGASAVKVESTCPGVLGQMSFLMTASWSPDVVEDSSAESLASMLDNKQLLLSHLLYCSPLRSLRNMSSTYRLCHLRKSPWDYFSSARELNIGVINQKGSRTPWYGRLCKAAAGNETIGATRCV
ncbi:hypothetical protein K437DRAFT_256863 [Tilletiaria anomala UBC 951]|uniref:Uncharacterized protein n=1 Tax=Tilletiaria anomala (strain ATCC 24038 / CBS 436.72 / UBC 951) TaxID=1037660 RepID=A0A066VXB5_TILAU|nr:uncharacterized protein K437DRAFT_256863 [Tilletiaria anomala UBC 951]KDN44913.1 hypothetical protein K437DRAFT_256863 [Tilletiaria anomala UBC 951]